MQDFANIVSNSAGTPIAGFISSIDARRYAQDQASYYDHLVVADYGGTVTRHVKGEPIAIIVKGVPESVAHVCEHFTVSIPDPAEAA